jgi:uncharacterized protein YbjT (DUF2867 family)
MSTTRKIAVAGASGRVGRPLVEVLESRGHDVVPISRSHSVDIITGAGLDAALTGVEVVVDAATGPSPDQQAATEFFTTAARNLQEAGRRAGVQRIIVVSIIGTDRFTGGYAAAKVAHEQATLSGPIPALVLRAAQFHEFVPQLIDWGRQGEVCYVQEMRTQPVAAHSVAETLAAFATDLGWEGGTFAEVAGPREERLVALATAYAARLGDPVKIEGVSNPADPDSELYAAGALLPGPDAILTGPTFEEWLDTRS